MVLKPTVRKRRSTESELGKKQAERAAKDGMVFRKSREVGSSGFRGQSAVSVTPDRK